MAKFLIGFFLGVGIAYLAYRANTLNRSGAIAAAVLGTIVFGLGGIAWAVVLLTFFISSSALSKLFRQQKSVVGQNFSKGSHRDAGQVAANGGVAGVLALLHFILLNFSSDHPYLGVLWLGFCASLAAANADTWGTELGVLNPHRPVMLTSFKPVPRGTSGAVSFWGTISALGGAAFVGVMAVLASFAGWSPQVALPGGLLFIFITVGGFIGALVDSFLGATFQGIYHCPSCQKETEHHPVHTCGTATTLKRGMQWLNNDWVNTACTMSAGLVGLLLGSMIG